MNVILNKFTVLWQCWKIGRTVERRKLAHSHTRAAGYLDVYIHRPEIEHYKFTYFSFHHMVNLEQRRLFPDNRLIYSFAGRFRNTVIYQLGGCSETIAQLTIFLYSLRVGHLREDFPRPDFGRRIRYIVKTMKQLWRSWLYDVLWYCLFEHFWPVFYFWMSKVSDNCWWRYTFSHCQRQLLIIDKKRTRIYIAMRIIKYLIAHNYSLNNSPQLSKKFLIFNCYHS